MKKAVAFSCLAVGVLILTYCVGTFHIALLSAKESGDGTDTVGRIMYVIWFYLIGLFVACFSVVYGFRVIKSSR